MCRIVAWTFVNSWSLPRFGDNDAVTEQFLREPKRCLLQPKTTQPKKKPTRLFTYCEECGVTPPLPLTILFAELFVFFHNVHEHGYISNTYCLISFIFFTTCIIKFLLEKKKGQMFLMPCCKVCDRWWYWLIDWLIDFGVVGQSFRPARERLGVWMPAATDPSRENKLWQLHCQTLSNRCECHGFSQMTFMNWCPVSP